MSSLLLSAALRLLSRVISVSSVCCKSASSCTRTCRPADLRPTTLSAGERRHERMHIAILWNTKSTQSGRVARGDGKINKKVNKMKCDALIGRCRWETGRAVSADRRSVLSLVRGCLQCEEPLCTRSPTTSPHPPHSQTSDVESAIEEQVTLHHTECDVKSECDKNYSTYYKNFIYMWVYILYI